MPALKVSKWLVKGEFAGDEKNSDDILDNAGRLLDKSCSNEICGQNVFQASDGKFYQVQVQAQIVELSSDEAEQIIEDAE